MKDEQLSQRRDTHKLMLIDVYIYNRSHFLLIYENGSFNKYTKVLVTLVGYELR